MSPSRPKYRYLIECNCRLAGAWPPSDHAIRDLLVGWGEENDDLTLVGRRYLCFFTAVFEETEAHVRQCLKRDDAENGLAACWRQYLSDNDSAQRVALYKDVATKAVRLHGSERIDYLVHLHS